MTETSIQYYDELNVRSSSDLTKLVGPKETILFSGLVSKINKFRIAQERTLVITDKYLYNICLSGTFLNNISVFFSHKSALKRKIDINKISEITISIHPDSEQFIIHVEDEYDYRYNGLGLGKREKIIDTICQRFFASGNKLFVLYLKEVEDLAAFHTTDTDFKANIIKRPNLGKIMVTQQLWEKGLDFIIKNRNSFVMEETHGNDQRAQSEIMVNRSDSPPPFERFKALKSIGDIPLTVSGVVPKNQMLEQGASDLMAQAQFPQKRGT